MAMPGEQAGRRGPGRPRAASRDDVERLALDLMLRNGYDRVSIETIVAAAGISRTTLFRYFGSKSAIVWGAFDATNARLADALDSVERPVPPVEAACAAIVASTRQALAESEVWWERFRLIDSSSELLGATSERWERWKQIVTIGLAERADVEAGAPGPIAAAGALHAVFVSSLRTWEGGDEAPEGFLRLLERTLSRITPALEGVLRS
jgi:AcrR family transcriptional regulator